MGMVKVLSLTTGRVVLMDESLAGRYYRVNGRYVVGSPVNDALALRSSFLKLGNTPAPAINWKSMPSIPSGGGDYVLPPDYYLNDDPSRPLLNITGLNRRVVVAGTPGKPMFLRSRGDLISGYGARLLIQNTTIQAANPGVFGQAAGRLLRCDDAVRIEIYNNFLDGTSGISLGTAGSRVWQGNPANGDTIRIGYNRVRNIRGQKSNGTYDPANPLAISPIHSNWGPTHNEADRWNPSVPLAQRTSANMADPQKFGQLGWEPAQFVQIRDQPGLVGCWISFNEILGQYGECRVEDNINLYHGSGGTAASPLLIEGNFVNQGQGLDWNYRPNQGMTYDGSNQVTANATSYQNPTKTFYSGTIHITDDYYESTVTGSWELNEAYITFRNTVGVGNKINLLGGHHIRLEGCKLYEAIATETGDPLAIIYKGYQVTRYDDDDGTPAQARTQAGVMKDIWGNNYMGGCEYSEGTTSGGQMLYQEGLNDLLMNGGVYENNLKFARPAPGFETQVHADWLAANTAAGRTIGPSS